MNNEITPLELNHTLQTSKDSSKNLVLIDVRESDELVISSLPNHIHIPLGEIESRYNEIPKDKEVIVYCRVGGRSGQAVNFLLSKGYTNVKNLIGGINRWADEVDPEMTKY